MGWPSTSNALYCTMTGKSYNTASGMGWPSTPSPRKQVKVELKSCFLKTFAIFPGNPACCRKTCFQKHGFNPSLPLLHLASAVYYKKLKTSTENSRFPASAKVFSFSWNLHIIFYIVKQQTLIGNLMPVLMDHLNTYGTSQI